MEKLSYRKWTIIFSVFILSIAAAVLGIWWWRSLAFVSTDDARIKADIVTISSEIYGRITDLTKTEGDKVSPNEILARLDSSEIRIQIQQAQAEIDRAKSRLLHVQRGVDMHEERYKGEILQAEAGLRAYRYNLEDALVHEKQAKEDHQRTKSLYKKELISPQKLTHAKTEHRQAELRVSALQEKLKEGEAHLELIRIKGREISIKEANLKVREAELRQTNVKLADLQHKFKLTIIRSPVSGLIVKKNTHIGEYIEAGNPIFMVVDSTHYWIEANIEETAIRFVKLGSKAIVKVDSYPGRDFFGEVSKIGGATVSEFSLFSPQKLTGVFIKSTQRLPVKIKVENTNGLLKVGMLAVVWIKKYAH